jgi:hypothetical protein
MFVVERLIALVCMRCNSHNAINRSTTNIIRYFVEFMRVLRRLNDVEMW